MLGIRTVDHVGVRVSDRDRSVAFYEALGFEFVADGGFEQGHPVVMLHPSGVVFNLLGPANKGAGANILMDVADKYPGITHVALKIDSAEDAEKLFEAKGIAITGRRSFRGVETVFIRDPDRNVLELVGPGPAVVDLIREHMGAPVET